MLVCSISDDSADRACAICGKHFSNVLQEVDVQSDVVVNQGDEIARGGLYPDISLDGGATDVTDIPDLKRVSTGRFANGVLRCNIRMRGPVDQDKLERPQ
jgi:hypothetical protein